MLNKYVFDKDFELQIPVSGIWYIILEAWGEGSGSGSGEGYDSPKSIKIGIVIATENNTINFTLNYQVSQLIPSPLSLQYEQFNLFRTKWQNIIGPNIIPNPNEYTYEFAYPIKYNILIAHLIVRDMLIKAGSDFMMALFEGSVFSKQEISPTGIVGTIKNLKTGPIEAEWFDGANVLKEIFKTNGDFDTINSAICTMASDLGIKLHFCDGMVTPITPIIVKPRIEHVYKSATVVQV